MAEETALFARKYRILQKVKWGSGDLDERGEQIMQFIWTRYYYSRILPVMGDIMKEFPDPDVEIQVEKLVKKGYLMPLF